MKRFILDVSLFSWHVPISCSNCRYLFRLRYYTQRQWYIWKGRSPFPTKRCWHPDRLPYLWYMCPLFLHLFGVALQSRLCVYFKPYFVRAVPQSRHVAFSFNIDEAVRDFGFGFWMLTAGTWLSEKYDTLVSLGAGVSMMRHCPLTGCLVYDCKALSAI